jgi:hypothetical protein
MTSPTLRDKLTIIDRLHSSIDQLNLYYIELKTYSPLEKAIYERDLQVIICRLETMATLLRTLSLDIPPHLRRRSSDIDPPASNWFR